MLDVGKMSYDELLAEVKKKFEVDFEDKDRGYQIITP